jgi:uncharacterized 2Fe-2S/4Fe-4S cluster protein (DUF4445 family)
MSGNSTRYNIRFEPDNVEIAAAEGANLMETAIAAGVHINASCGGQGTCGSCNVLIKEGSVDGQISSKISAADFKKGFRQSCRSRIMSDLVVEIPATSRLEVAILDKESNKQVNNTPSLATGWQFNPPVTKTYITLSQPQITDNKSDFERLLQGLKPKYNPECINADIALIRKLPGILRQADWQVTVTILQCQNCCKIINVEAGDTRNKHLGLVFDIGTTGIRGQLLDLNRGKVLANSIDYNGQISYGADVISRMVQCQTPGGSARMRKAVVGTLNKLIQGMVKQSGTDIQRIAYIVVAANTVMIHLLFELDTKYLRLSPYVPAAGSLPPVPARELEIETNEHAHIYTIPSVASYIGGDIVSGILGSGIYQQSAITLYIDIGTNGEIVIGNHDWMVTAAASAGPAFEGGGIKNGMMAVTGAIEDFELESFSKPILHTIGDEKPAGICGSGLINITATMLKAGIIGPNGKFNTELTSDRIRHDADGWEYVLAWANESATHQDIVLTEIDLDNLMRTKAAIFAGCQTLANSVGMQCNQMDRVIIAGTFGNRINIENAITIGLLPDLPRDKFGFIGNGSLLGARLSAFSSELLRDGHKIASMMTNLELSENPDFMNNYTAAMFFPHTNAREFFPSISIKNSIKNWGERA